MSNGIFTVTTLSLLVGLLAAASLCVLGETETWDEQDEFIEGMYQSTGHIGSGGVTLTGNDEHARMFMNRHLSEGSAGSYDGTAILYPSALHVKDRFYIYYTAQNSSDYSIALATDTDGYGIYLKEGVVLSRGGSTDWDGYSLQSCCVMYEDGMFKMWYLGISGSFETAVGYATSPDGVSWTKYSSNPVLTTPTSGIGSKAIQNPSVVKVDDMYYMYLAMNWSSTTAIGLATSPDGTTWTYHGSNPVLDKAPSGEFGAYEVNFPCVVRDGPGFTMYYTGRTSIGDLREVACAYSFDGIEWTRDPDIAIPTGLAEDDDNINGVSAYWYDDFLWVFYGSYDGSGTNLIHSAQRKPWFMKGNGRAPIVSNGTSYDMGYLNDPCVLRTHYDKYYLYYEGYGLAPDNEYRFYMATSSHPSGPWTKYAGALLSPSPSGWDQVIRGLCAFHDGLLYRLYYGGDSGSSNWAIGLATDDYGSYFIKYGSNPVLTNGSVMDWDFGGVYDPWVLRVGDTYHMYYTGHYASTTYSAIGHATSADGIAWEKDPYNPVVVPDPLFYFMKTSVRNPVVLHEDGTYTMYFSGGPAASTYHQSFVAHSLDGTNWTVDPRHTFLQMGNSTDWDDYSVQLGSVLRVGGTEYMYYSGDNGSSRTQVGIGVREATSGAWTSPIVDASRLWPVDWRSLDWDATVPIGCELTFQVATNNGGSIWRFLGPDGTPDTYYNSPGQAIWSGQTGRFARVRATFGSSHYGHVVPVLRSLGISYGQRDSPSPPLVTLTSPNGGEDWMKTKTYPVTWTARGNLDPTSIGLYYSTNNGSSWNQIASGIPNNGLYMWTVPSTETSGAVVKIVAWDIDGVGATDTSDATFAIDPPPPKTGAFLSPAAGDVLAPGMHGASWVVNDPWGLAELPLTLELTTDGGLTWAVLADALPLSGGVEWDVPVLAESSEECMLRLSVLNWLGDISIIESGTFSIDVTAPAVTLDAPPDLVAGTECALTARATDDLVLSSLVLHVSDGEAERTWEMTVEDGTWRCAFTPGEGDALAWVTASDGVHEASSEVLELDVGTASAASTSTAPELAIAVGMALIVLGGIVVLVSRRRR